MASQPWQYVTGLWERWNREDLRALTPLFHTHINPFGVFELDLESESFLNSGLSAGRRRVGTSGFPENGHFGLPAATLQKFTLRIPFLARLW